MKADLLVAEIGSTTTVVNAFSLEPPRFLGQGQAPTTVLEGDVRIGLQNARDSLAKGLGTDRVDCGEMLATSSAAGGLRMTVHGLIYDMTVKAAREAALGAGGTPPTAQCELGPVWFRPTKNGWLGYLPVTYNAEGGDWPITVTLDDMTLTATLTVRSTEYPSTQTSSGEAATAEANEEFRRVIWSLYDQGSSEARWNGAFQYPVQGASIFQRYGAYLYDGEKSAGRAANLTLLCPENALVSSPAAGRVAYAGNLQLTGNTVVIDHGCGVKSYLFGLSGIAGVATGDEVTAGQGLGVAGRKLIWEVRIGNKSVDPQKLTQGGSNGLFYRPVGDELR